METPKINFIYSPIYDGRCKECTKLLERGKNITYPSSQEIIRFIKQVEKRWKPQEKKILTEMAKLVNFSWSDKEIKCYIVGRCRPFSDPLTIMVYYQTKSKAYDIDQFIDTLTHELIHQLFIQDGNRQRGQKAWDYIHRKYKKESLSTKVHIVLESIHKAIYLKFFDEKRLQNDIRWAKKVSKKYKQYKRAWEIVERDGYQNIIKEFKKRTK